MIACASVLVGVAVVALLSIKPDLVGVHFEGIVGSVFLPPIPGALGAGTLALCSLSISTIFASEIPMRIRIRWSAIAALITLALGVTLSAVGVFVRLVIYFADGGC